MDINDFKNVKYQKMRSEDILLHTNNSITPADLIKIHIAVWFA